MIDYIIYISFFVFFQKNSFTSVLHVVFHCCLHMFYKIFYAHMKQSKTLQKPYLVCCNIVNCLVIVVLCCVLYAQHGPDNKRFVSRRNSIVVCENARQKETLFLPVVRLKNFQSFYFQIFLFFQAINEFAAIFCHSMKAGLLDPSSLRSPNPGSTSFIMVKTKSGPRS